VLIAALAVDGGELLVVATADGLDTVGGVLIGTFGPVAVPELHAGTTITAAASAATQLIVRERRWGENALRMVTSLA
jgi:uncharacterized membrane protein (UPF0136 family)